jgi:outer membrane protein
MKKITVSRSRPQIVPMLGILLWGLTASSLWSQTSKELLTLGQAVQRALENNQLVKASALGVDAAGVRTRFAFSGYLPKISFDHNATAGNNPVYVFGSLLNQRQFTEANFALDRLNNPDALSNFQNKFSFTQPLFDGFRTRTGVRLARLGQNISEKDLEKTKSDLIFRVFKAYYQVLLAVEMVRVSEETVKSASADLEKAQAAYHAGLAVESDLLSVKVFLASQTEELVKARNQLKLARSNLNFEMGEALEQTFELVRPQNALVSEELDLAALQKQALDTRPDFRQVVLASQSSEVGIQAAKSEYWPTINGFGSWETDNRSFWGHSGNNWVVGVNVHFNIFNGRADEARLEENRILARRQAAMQQHLAQAIRLQVQQAFLELDSARQRITVSEQATAQGEESLRIIRNRYQAGLTTVTDLLHAETALIGAKTNYLRALIDHRIGRANLEMQVGRLSADSNNLFE